MQIKRLEETLDQCLTERGGPRRRAHASGRAARRLCAAAAGAQRRGRRADDRRHPGRRGARRGARATSFTFISRSWFAPSPRPSGRPHRRRVASRAAPCASGSTPGALDLILTTDAEAGPGAETLAEAPLVWIGAPGGQAWRRRPLPLATVFGCAFSRAAIERLSQRRPRWAIAVEVLEDRRRRGGRRRPGDLHDARRHHPARLRGHRPWRRAAGASALRDQHDRHPGTAAAARRSRSPPRSGRPMPAPGRSPPSRDSPRPGIASSHSDQG